MCHFEMTFEIQAIDFETFYHENSWTDKRIYYCLRVCSSNTNILGTLAELLFIDG